MAKIEETKAEEPKVEEAKVDEPKAEEPKAEEAKAEEPKPKEPEAPKELEADAVPDARKKLGKGAVALSATDSTLNVLPTPDGALLVSLQDGGFSNLLAGARATAGVKNGRYMFEAQIVSLGDAKVKKPVLRLGFSVANSSLFLTDPETSIGFDDDGIFLGKTKKKVGQKFQLGQTVAVLLNLDASSPNANTVSLFRDGVRLSPPMPLPETLVGKVLFPTVTYKGVTLRLNFGPSPLAPLPFSCRMVADAAEADVELAKGAVPKDGKYQVVVPVSLPDRGTFDWADKFLAENPDFTELSDRMISDWAKKSGGALAQDDTSVSRTLAMIAPTQKRNYLVMGVKKSLLPEERKKTLARFGPEFKKTAKVALGEPNAEWKKHVQSILLKSKKAAAEADAKKKKLENERKRKIEEQKKKVEAAKKARLAGGAKKDTEDAVEEPEPVKEEEPEEEIKVELTDEEQKVVFRKAARPDLSPAELAACFSKFAIPEKAEGFESITFEWANASESADFLKKWVHEKKLTSRVDDLKPSAWFKGALSAFQKTLGEWKKRQNEWKNPTTRKALVAKLKAAKAKAATEAAGEGAPAVAEEELPKVEADDVAPLAVEDVVDIGSGEPLFQNFTNVDWTLVSARFELHLLTHAFRKDLDDPERPAFAEPHLGFYYQKYFGRSFSPKAFACDNFTAVAALLKDTLVIGADTLVRSKHSEEVDAAHFVKLAEEHRRDRQRRVDAGDETAELKFPSAPAGAPRGTFGGAAGAAPQQGQSAPLKRSWGAPAQFAPAGKAPRYGAAPSYGGYGQGGYGGGYVRR